VEGDYEFGETGIHGTFAGHGVTGKVSFEIDQAAVTIATTAPPAVGHDEGSVVS